MSTSLYDSTALSSTKPTRNSLKSESSPFTTGTGPSDLSHFFILNPNFESGWKHDQEDSTVVVLVLDSFSDLNLDPVSQEQVTTIALSCIRTIEAEHMDHLLRFLLLSATLSNVGRIIATRKSLRARIQLAYDRCKISINGSVPWSLLNIVLKQKSQRSLFVGDLKSKT